MSKLTIIALIVAVISIGAAQTKILLCDFENRGVDSTLIRTTTQLLKDALNATYKFTVMELPPETKCYSVVDASNLAKKFGVTKALIGNIMRIGSKMFHSYQYIDVNSATVELADKIETPPLEEFPIMCDRIATSISEKKTYKETVEPEKVIQTEVEPGIKHPRKPYASIFLTAGYLFHPFSETPRQYRSGSSTSVLAKNLVNLNCAVSFETEQLLTLMQIGLMRGLYEERDLAFDLLLNYVIGKGDFAPFTGAGIGITRYTWDDPITGYEMKDDALSLSAGIGMVGLRTYYFRLLTAAYFNYSFTGKMGGISGLKVIFGVTSPSLGPDATVKISPGLVGGMVGGIFLTGLVIALTS